MPPQSRFGIKISRNRQKNHKLSLAARAVILAKLNKGKSQREIAQEFQIIHLTVGLIKRRWDKLGTAARA